MFLDLHHSDPTAKARGEPGDVIAHRRCNRATSKAKPKPPKPVTPNMARRLAAVQMAEARQDGRVW
jgi:hypothetical protein